jgi:hypothetical protein
VFPAALKVDKSTPHLMNLSADPSQSVLCCFSVPSSAYFPTFRLVLSVPTRSGALLFFFQNEVTNIGNSKELKESKVKNDIVINATFIHPHHAVARKAKDGTISIEPVEQAKKGPLLPPSPSSCITFLSPLLLLSSIFFFFPSSFSSIVFLPLFCLIEEVHLYVNGKKITAATKLAYGDRIIIGKNQLFR